MMVFPCGSTRDREPVKVETLFDRCTIGHHQASCTGIGGQDPESSHDKAEKMCNERDNEVVERHEKCRKNSIALCRAPLDYEGYF